MTTRTNVIGAIAMQLFEYDQVTGDTTIDDAREMNRRGWTVEYNKQLDIRPHAEPTTMRESGIYLSESELQRAWAQMERWRAGDYSDTTDLLSVRQVAGRLNVTRQRVHQLIQLGRLPAEKLGSQLVIQSRDVDALEDWERTPDRPRKVPAPSA